MQHLILLVFAAALLPMLSSCATVDSWSTVQSDGTSFSGVQFSNRRSHIFAHGGPTASGEKIRRAGDAASVSLYGVASNASVWDTPVPDDSYIGAAGAAPELAVASNHDNASLCVEYGAKSNATSCVLVSIWQDQSSSSPSSTKLATGVSKLNRDQSMVSLSADGTKLLIAGFACKTGFGSGGEDCSASYTHPYPLCLVVDVISTSTSALITSVIVSCDLPTLASVYAVAPTPDGSTVAISYAFEGQSGGGMYQSVFRLALVDAVSGVVTETDICVGYCDLAGSSVSPNGKYVNVLQMSMTYDVHLYEYTPPNSRDSGGGGQLQAIRTIHIGEAAGVDMLVWLLDNGDVLVGGGSESNAGFKRYSGKTGSVVYSAYSLPFGLWSACMSVSLDHRFALILNCGQHSDDFSSSSNVLPVWVFNVEKGTVVWSSDLGISGFSPTKGVVSTASNGKGFSVAVVGSQPSSSWGSDDTLGFAEVDLS